MMENHPSGWANPAILGLLAFAAAFIIAGLTSLPSPYGNGFGARYMAGGYGVFGYASTVSVFSVITEWIGGAALLLAGVISFRVGQQYWGTAFILYGFFWLSFSNLAAASATGYGLAALMFIFLLISLTFLINSMKHGWGTFIIFLLTTLAMILWIVQFWMIAPLNTKPTALSSGFSWAIGGELILTGLAAWYLATAHLTNSNYGRKVLPH
jgi:uncharacterized protein